MNKDLLSIYAAVLSTAVALWRVYEFFDDRRGKITCKLNVITEFITFHGGGISNGETKYNLTVTNKGKNKRIIERPSVEMNKSNSGEKYATVFNKDNPDSFPKPLETGDKFQYKINLGELKNSLKDKGASKFRFNVDDTHGKRYNSNWMKL